MSSAAAATVRRFTAFCAMRPLTEDETKTFFEKLVK
jgi:hypothetical protein